MRKRRGSVTILFSAEEAQQVLYETGNKKRSGFFPLFSVLLFLRPNLSRQPDFPWEEEREKTKAAGKEGTGKRKNEDCAGERNGKRGGIGFLKQRIHAGGFVPGAVHTLGRQRGCCHATGGGAAAAMIQQQEKKNKR